MIAASMTRLSAAQLAAAIRDGQLSSVDVVTAHIERLRETHAAINAVVAERYEEALAEAAAVDLQVAATAADRRDTLAPLLGVPCTIKESIQLIGMPNSAGTTHRRDYRSERTAPAVQRVLDAGAIPLGVTNTSELTMWVESVNRVYGLTRNAYDPARTAGGSSGGEGAAVGSGGVPFGIGSDIGGSIRLPAFFNGVFGHKASANLIPNTGQWPGTDGDAAEMLTIGPLTRRAEDLMPLLTLLAGPDGEDARTRDVVLGDPADVVIAGLDVVLAESTSVVPASRELRDARDRAGDALAAAGARVHRVELTSMRRALEYYLATLSSGSGSVPTAAMIVPEGHPPRGLRDAWRARNTDHTPALLLLLAAEAVSVRLPQGQTRRAVAAGRALTAEIEGVIGDGVLLHPPFSRVAPKHGQTVGRPWMLTPAAVFNLAGLPATQVPLGLNAEGLPLGVQVVAGRDRDHVAIACAIELERALGGWTPPAGA